MMVGSKCTVCGKRPSEQDANECEICGNRLHTRCSEYYQTFECPNCGDETWIGAVEL